MDWCMPRQLFGNNSQNYCFERFVADAETPTNRWLVMLIIRFSSVCFSSVRRPNGRFVVVLCWPCADSVPATNKILNATPCSSVASPTVVQVKEVTNKKSQLKKKRQASRFLDLVYGGVRNRITAKRNI